MKKNIIFILLISICTLTNAQVNDLNIGEMVQPVPESYVFQDPAYFTWGGSVVAGKDGKYHMLYARWHKTLGFSAWVTDSEIAHAVADKLEGPYVTTGTVLKRRGHSFWDGMTTHNPTVIEKDGKYYLYYMGTTGPVDIKQPTKEQWRQIGLYGIKKIAESINVDYKDLKKIVVVYDKYKELMGNIETAQELAKEDVESEKHNIKRKVA